jgi:hypothetical protein
MDIQKLGSILICLFASQGIAAAATTLIAGTGAGPYRSTDGGAPIAIQVPDTLPDGDWPVQAAIGGVRHQQARFSPSIGEEDI